jgi:hypothetical protein
MASNRSFRDRFFTPPVARAITSPLGILLAGVGAAIGIVAGGGIPLAIGLGVAAWGGRVAAAVPRNATAARIDPFTLGEPWKRAVIDAQQAQGRFRDAVRTTESGPLRERMVEIGQRIDVGVDEAFRVAKQGQNLVAARRRIDDTGARRDLAEAQRDKAASGGDALDRTIESLEAQLASADRLDRTIAETRDRLRLTNARLDQAVAQATELSVQAGDVGDLAGLGDDVDALVTDLEALRLGLEEANRPAPGTA